MRFWISFNFTIELHSFLLRIQREHDMTWFLNKNWAMQCVVIWNEKRKCPKMKNIFQIGTVRGKKQWNENKRGKLTKRIVTHNGLSSSLCACGFAWDIKEAQPRPLRVDNLFLLTTSRLGTTWHSLCSPLLLMGPSVFSPLCHFAHMLCLLHPFCATVTLGDWLMSQS